MEGTEPATTATDSPPDEGNESPVATAEVAPGVNPAVLASQTQNEPQQVPEQRPIAAQSPIGGVSAASTRLDTNVPATQEEIDRANSDEAKQASIATSRTPRLLEGQRVQIIDGPEAGRMGFVSQVVFTDAVQQMLAATGVPEARFAEVAQYIVRTRDGRSDILALTPAEVKPLDDIQGWGRGQI